MCICPGAFSSLSVNARPCGPPPSVISNTSEVGRHKANPWSPPINPTTERGARLGNRPGSLRRSPSLSGHHTNCKHSAMLFISPPSGGKIWGRDRRTLVLVGR